MDDAPNEEQSKRNIQANVEEWSISVDLVMEEKGRFEEFNDVRQ